MNVKAIMQYLGKCRREISELANVRGEKSVSYWFDYLWCAKLLQKSEMRKDIVIELSYKGFS